MGTGALLAISCEITCIVSEQGTRMGRQSFLHITLAMQGDQIQSIKVGGSAVAVLEGELALPTS